MSKNTKKYERRELPLGVFRINKNQNIFWLLEFINRCNKMVSLYPFIVINMKQRYSHISILVFLPLALLCYLSTSLSATPFFEINNKYIETGKTKMIQDLTLCLLLRSTEIQLQTQLGNSFLRIPSAEAMSMVFVHLPRYQHSIIT